MIRTIALSAGAAALLFVTPAFAHHPSGSRATPGAGPIITIPAATLEKGHSSAAVVLEVIEFTRLSDAELAVKGHPHSLDALFAPALFYSYGVTDDLTLTLRIPFVRRTNIREGHVHDGVPEIDRLGDSAGVGDLSMLAQYRFLKNRASQSEAALLLGVSAPTGDTSVNTAGGERFETEFQPGTGGWDGLFGLAFTQRFRTWSFDANVLYILATEGAQNTELGDRFQYNAAISYRLFGSLSAPVDSVFGPLPGPAFLGGPRSSPHKHTHQHSHETVAPSQGPALDATLYGSHLCRKFASTTIAPGGLGKSSLVLVEALAIVTGRDLLGIGRAPKPGRVWYWNGEDPYEELQRRIQAVCLHYGISQADIEGRLFVNSGRETPIVIAKETRDGAVIMIPVVDAIKADIRENQIDVMTVDPFVSCHRVSENDNNKIEAVAWEWAKIADEGNCAVELVHHSRKTNGAEVTASDGRGASALNDKMRSARALNRMTDDEGKKAGVDNPWQYFRVGDDKPNMAPRAASADWYRLQGVCLGNATGERPSDDVGVVTGWTWPDPLAAVSDAEALDKVRRALTEGQWRSSPQAKQWAGKPIAEALDLDAEKPTHRESIKELIERALRSGVLVEYEAQDEKRNARKFIKPNDAPSEFDPIAPLATP